MLLFGSETQVLIPQLEKSLDEFHHQAARQMASMVPKQQQDRTWVYPPIGAALVMVVLEEIGVYITRRHNTVAQYIANRPIMGLFWQRNGSRSCAYPGNGGSILPWISWVLGRGRRPQGGGGRQGGGGSEVEVEGEEGRGG